MRKLLLVILTTIGLTKSVYAQESLQGVSFSSLTITDNFWKPRLQTIATKTLNACIAQTEIKTPRIRNFEKIVNKTGERHEGIYYDDSDVYKALEAIAYSLNNFPDKKLEETADRWIDVISKSQLQDGYLNTYYQLGDLSQRWTDIEKHEDYNAGHLIEAAVAYYHATGKDKLLQTAIRFANHIDSTFRLGNKPWFSGHQEIELALVKLYNVTRNDRYLKLSEWYLQQRGKGHYPYGTNWITPDYWQDLKPVHEQTEITGHAVRAMYQYTGAADVAVALRHKQYAEAMRAVWEDVVFRNLYITGGIGSSGRNEGFSIDYDLPNMNAYCETCASVGMVFWNQRMNRLNGDSKFIDVLERSLYNGSLSGLSLTGDRFFYGNPLASFGTHTRKEWFGTACCPSNIARLTASVGDYIYATSTTGLWINLFIANKAKLAVGKQSVSIELDTNYPWDGKGKLTVNPDKQGSFDLHVRIPGWAQSKPVPGDLYSFKENKNTTITFRLNDKVISPEIIYGYAVIKRTWKKGDVVEWDFPMEVQEVVAHEQVKQNTDRVALQRGPLMYCVEGVDNNGAAWDFIVPDNTHYTSEFKPDLLGGVVVITFEAQALKGGSSPADVLHYPKTITAIPYYAWNNRGANEMQVWLPKKVKEVRINPEN
ncbi:MAG: glycoside hydrolase family 127 protein [Cyclobacteriaceae bacterium]|nr:glycoside hydrolase family 127 protein [Cyclobacteriaceae bacterium]UYN85308.1 MAG: glycoside hydrolase family 127 protein [Cyclobacteriaceae bacterium]